MTGGGGARCNGHHFWRGCSVFLDDHRRCSPTDYVATLKTHNFNNTIEMAHATAMSVIQANAALLNVVPFCCTVDTT